MRGEDEGGGGEGERGEEKGGGGEVIIIMRVRKN